METRLNVPEGDHLACDATLLDVHATRVDELLLTGGSVPVDKAVVDDDGGLVSASTLVVHGDGVACITATGVHTPLGCIGGSPEPRPRRLQEGLKCAVCDVTPIALLSTQQSSWWWHAALPHFARSKDTTANSCSI